MVDYARDEFDFELDWSDMSIASIEAIAASFHEHLAAQRPSDDEVMQMSRAIGSYIGEVLRRNHDAVWGYVTMNGSTFDGMKITTKSGQTSLF